MKRFPLIVFTLLFAIYFFCYNTVLSHVLFYHEQHHLFLFSKEYFFGTLRSEGAIAYLTNFIIQFFYKPMLGAALMALMLTSISASAYKLIRIATGRQDIFWFSLIPSLWLFLHTMTVEHSISPVVVTFVISILCVTIANLCRHPLIPISFSPSVLRRKAVSRSISAICICLYLTLAVSLFFKRYNRSERILLVAEQAVKERDWNKALDFTENYLRSGRQNQLVSYFYHMALYHTKGLENHLFDIPHKIGVKALYFPWNSDTRESEYGHFLYEELGYLNEAQRWEFEAMVVWGETAPHLLNLARYAICNNRPKVAQRYINKLKKSLFYSNQALDLEKHLYSGKVPGLRQSSVNEENGSAQFANVINIGPELDFICKRDSTNRMAYDYLMAHLLLSNHVTQFVKHLPERKLFHQDVLPEAYEEALLIYKLKVGDEEFGNAGFSIRPQTEERFARYYELANHKQLRKLQEEFGNSYWFYLNYLSPYGNKVIAE